MIFLFWRNVNSDACFYSKYQNSVDKQGKAYLEKYNDVIRDLPTHFCVSNETLFVFSLSTFDHHQKCKYINYFIYFWFLMLCIIIVQLVLRFLWFSLKRFSVKLFVTFFSLQFSNTLEKQETILNAKHFNQNTDHLNRTRKAISYFGFLSSE
jgi:hypothetical protein